MYGFSLFSNVFRLARIFVSTWKSLKVVSNRKDCHRVTMFVQEILAHTTRSRAQALLLYLSF